jgi:hypothetical protein
MPLFHHTKLATYLHKYNFVNGEESVFNFTPCNCSDVPENTDIIEKNHRLLLQEYYFAHCLFPEVQGGSNMTRTDIFKP